MMFFICKNKFSESFLALKKKIKKEQKDEETTCGTSAVFYLSVPTGPQPEPIPDPIPDDD